ncbi:hypothetical protein [Metallibacterium sp.]|uniref:hypothetical protein n=1 Tax=Metallibacterium sp. TaxID=2940281 RepID=UPI00262EC624|nr:hypothetical protein [Metallibacterium sp.]
MDYSNDFSAISRDWLHHSGLTLREAAHILCNREPKVLGWATDDVRALRSLIEQDVHAGKLKTLAIYVGGLGNERQIDQTALLPDDQLSFERSTVEVKELQRWCEQIDRPHPWQVAQQKDSSPELSSVPDERPLDPRERTSLLRIIRALGVMANLKARGAATPIVRQLQELGFDGPHEATIRQVLDQARGLEAEKKPQ